MGTDTSGSSVNAVSMLGDCLASESMCTKAPTICGAEGFESFRYRARTGWPRRSESAFVC